ncbi:ABC transporter permease [Paenibacillus sp. NPDC056579]|uniref:ABC transporter permease n=1 Tax=Paenibacillus sp. NPDC056579 TaxID=3345871 RepID=UPI0036AE7CD1
MQAASSSTARLKRSWQLYVLLLVPILYIVLFKYVPMYGALISFQNYSVTKGVWGSDWVGLKHFSRFFHSYDFAAIMRNTIVLSFYSMIAGFPVPILLALCFNYVGNKKFKNTAQMLTYAPHFFSIVVMVGIILQILSPSSGIVNNAIKLLGFEPVNFMANADYFPHIYVWSGIWQNVGFSCIIYLAALAGIDPALHEAAVVDGATKLQRMRHIDLPGIMPIAVILLILNAGNMLDTGFEKILLMQNPLNQTASQVIDTYVYKIGLASPALDFSYSSAIGLFKSVINLLLLLFVNSIARRAKQSSLW